MGWPSIVETAVGVVVLLVIVPPLVLFGRRRWLSSHGAVFDCALRPVGERPAGWSLGVERYAGDHLEWYRIFSLRFRPRYIFHRGATQALGHRALDATESVALFGNHEVVSVRSVDSGTPEVVELAMTPESATGLHAWLEAAPPGLRWVSDAG